MLAVGALADAPGTHAGGRQDGPVKTGTTSRAAPSASPRPGSLTYWLGQSCRASQSLPHRDVDRVRAQRLEQLGVAAEIADLDVQAVLLEDAGLHPTSAGTKAKVCACALPTRILVWAAAPWPNARLANAILASAMHALMAESRIFFSLGCRSG